MDQLCENDGPMRHNKVPDVPCLTHDRKCKRKLTDLNEAEKAGKSLYFVLFWKHFFCFYGRDCFLCFSREKFVGWWM